MNPPLRRGERVVLTADGRSVDAMVVLASKDGTSVALMFKGSIGNWDSGMAVEPGENGEWKSLDGMAVQIQRRETATPH